MIGLLIEQFKRRWVFDVGPFDSARSQVLANWFYRRQKFSLLDRESAHGEVDRGAFLQQEKRFEQG